MNIINRRHVSDILLFNANIMTFDPVRPRADWVLIDNGRIIGLGLLEELTHLKISAVETIDCGGKTVLPGFIDSHLHILSFAESLMTLNLTPAYGINSIADIKTKIHDFSRNINIETWIRGKGYNEFYLSEKRHPNRWDLDEAAPDHPVKLTHRSGHAHVLNSLALKRTGIDIETADPPGGIIERDDTGTPTGLLYETGDFLSSRIPSLNTKDMAQGIRMADQELVSCGITSVQDASARNNSERWKLFKSWKERGLLHPRINMMLGVKSFMEEWPEKFKVPLEDQLEADCVKIILDETTGQLNPSQPELDEIVLKIHESGMQAAIHAIEEKAVESACFAIERAVNKIPKADHRHRIEHCSVCPPSLVKHISGLGIRVVTQPAFIYYNGDRYLETVDSGQLDHLYPFASLLKAGIKVAGSSDCPIAPASPLAAIYAAVSRESENGKIVNQAQCIDVIDALRMYIEYGTDVTFTEGIKGRISPDKPADMVVLSDDPTKISSDKLKDIKVEMTIINGEIEWDGRG